MRETSWAARLSLFVAVALVSVMPATVSADEYPEGCVSCHVERTGKTDMRLSSLLAQVGHTSVERVRQVPRDCFRCHRPDEGSDDPPFSALIHEIHYDVPTVNTFVTLYEGDCRQCHSMDAEEGEAVVKGGAKNW